MIIGIGNDVAELDRFKEHVLQNDGFARKVLTPAELAVYETLEETGQVRFLAGRFSVKESFAKALGTGIGKGVAFQDIETINNQQGKPITRARIFHGRILTTITHSRTEAYTIVLLED